MSDDHQSDDAKTPPLSLGVYARSWAAARAYREMGIMRRRARVRRLLADPSLGARRSLYLVAALLILAAILLGSALLLVAGLLVLAIAAVPEIWHAYGLRGLTFIRPLEVTRTSFASVVEAPLVVENRSLLPLPFVEATDNFPDDLPALGMTLDISPLPSRAELVQTMGMWAFQRLRRRFYIRASQRGVFTFGPTTIKVTDPFGLLTREETLATEQTLIVHPLIAPLDRFGLAPQAPFGDRASRVRLLEDPLRVSGVRQYMPGDDPRRIHWKATARTGTPQSKILDPSTQRTLMIALDIRTFKSVQMGYDPELSELAISAAASVAHWAFQDGYAVGLLSNGSLATMRDMEAPQAGAAPRLRLAPSTRLEGLTQILDGLARLLPYNGASLASLLATERRTLPMGASLVYIGLDSMVDVPTLIALREIRARGRDVTLLLTSREGDADAEASDAGREVHASMLSAIYIGGRSAWRKLIKEALGDMSHRRASMPMAPDQLRNERALIAERRRRRRQANAALHSDSPENNVHGDGEHDREDVESARSSAAS